MRELLATITKKGQVTIPAEVRRHLGIKKGSKVAFVMNGDEVWLVTKGSVVEHTAEMMKGNGRPLAAEELREVAEEAVAEESVECIDE
jgi:AbrB family looped-hinge helix DNA binding protein